MADAPRFLIVGAGAIGTYLAVHLGRAGFPLALLVRPDTAERLRQHGQLELHTPQGLLTLPLPPLFTEPAEVTAADVTLLALKTYHLPAFLDSLRPVAHTFPPVLCLLNGVEAEAQLASVLGNERVLSGTVTTAVARLAPGQARIERARGLGIALTHPLAVRVVEAFHAAGLPTRTYTNAAAMKWSKLLTNLVANATSAILDLPPAAIYAHAELTRLEVAMLREALAVMRGLGLPLVDLPGPPIRLLGWAVRWLPLPLLRPALRRVVGSGRGGKMPSFHIDLHSGRGQTEVDALNGAVVRHGQRLGIPTPVNRLLTETLLALSQGQLDPATFRHNPEALLARWKRHP